MEVTESGMVMDLSAVLLNALMPMVMRAESSANVTSLRFLQSMNAEGPMVVSFFGKDADERPVFLKALPLMVVSFESAPKDIEFR